MNIKLLAIAAGVVLATGITVLAQDSYSKTKSKAAAKVEMNDPFALQKHANRRDRSTIDWSKHPKQLDPHTSLPGKGVIKLPAKAPLKESGLPQIRAYYWELMSGAPDGLYSFTFEPDAVPEYIAPMDMLKGYENNSGRYFGVAISSTIQGERLGTLYEYDTTDWSLVTKESCDPGLSYTDIAMDPTTGDVYGCFYIPETKEYGWGVANFEARTRTIIKPYDSDYWVNVVTCDGNGQYYTIDKDGMIAKVNKATGDQESLAAVNLEYDVFSGGCFNDNNGTIIVAADTDDMIPFFAEITPTTGASSIIFQAPMFSMLMGPYCVPQGNTLAPGLPGLEISCSLGAQSVDYVLTMPTELGNGDALEGTVTYSLSADGEEVLTGDANPGQTIEGNLPVDVNGFVTFVLTVSNEAGTSPVARTVCFVGTGSPEATEHVDAYHDGQKVCISWAPVTLSTDAGYIDPALMRYEITDINGDIVAEDVEGTTYEIPFAIPERGCVDLQYTIRACYDGKYSDPVSSGKVFVGTLAAPFELQMDIYNFGRHSVWDVNNDGRTWMHSAPYTYYIYGMVAADDWLISPEFMLEAGKIYPFKANAENLSIGNEVLEIKWGRQNTVDGMTEVISGPTDIVGSVDIMNYLMPQETGLYYVGFHALSPELQAYLALNSYSIGDPINATTPSSVTDLKVLGAWDGSLKATATFKAPTTDIVGNSLQKNVDITVRVGNEEVKTFTGVQPGAELSLDFGTELFPESKFYDFYFVSSNEDGTSIPFRYREFVGPKEPANPEIFNITKEGENFFTRWSPVTKATDGTDILPSNIKYKVHGLERTFSGLQVKECLTPEPITETSYQVYPDETEKQELAYYGVNTLNLENETGYIRYNSYLLGTPYTLPVKYSSAETEQFYELFISDSSVYAGWSFLSDFESQDEDGDWVGAYYALPGTQGAIKTGKISLVDAVDPVLSFFVYCFGDNINADVNKTDVIVDVDGVEYVIYTVDNSKLTSGKWNRVSCDLSQFIGKTIRVELCGTAISTVVSAWDNIQIRERVDYKFVADAAAPSKVSTDIPFRVQVKLLNDGEKDQTEPYTVSLYRNGVEVDTKEVKKALGAGERIALAFTQTLGADMDEENTYTAKITYKDGTGASLETSTGDATVVRRLLDIPVVQGLHGENVEEGVSLTWLPAEIDQESISQVTETFENCDSWAQEVYEWTFIDEDKEPVGGFTDFVVPNVVAYEDCVAFLVWDTAYEGAGNEEHTAHSGTKILTSLNAYTRNVQTSDWAVSPKLSGEEQTITIWARVLENNRGGEMAIYYSTGDDPTDLSAFVRCDEFTENRYMDSIEWAEFSATVPAGAKYFAVHSTGSRAYILLLDDASFVPAAPALVGYNVYCDGVRVNDAPVEDEAFLHTGVADGVHVYRVNAMYDKGASELSEPVSVMASGIIVGPDIMVSVMAQNQAIHIRGAEEQAVRIVSLDGKVIYTGKGDATVPVAPDMYMVTVGSTTLKILVK